MGPIHNARQHGFAILALLIPVSILIVLAAALSSLTSSSVRTISRSDRMTRAFYVADSAAQAANALVRATGPTMEATTVTESLGGGSATVVIEKVDNLHFRVRSSGEYGSETANVELHVKFEAGNFSLGGGLAFNIGQSVQTTGDLRIYLDSNPVISGYDHSATGSQLADQTNAVPGVGTHPVPGNPDFNFEITLLSNAEVEGSPSDTTAANTSQSGVLLDLAAYARDNADILITGSQTQTGTWGSSSSPQLVHASLNGSKRLTFDDEFVGHGTLVIETTNTSGPVFEMNSNARWYGLVVVVFRSDPEMSGAGILMDSNSRIVGGLGIAIEGTGITIDGSRPILKMRSNAEIRYSSALLSAARGIDSVYADSSRVATYRLGS